MRELSTQGLGDAAGMRAVTAFAAFAAARQTIKFFGSNIGSKPPQIWFQVNPDVIPRACRGATPSPIFSSSPSCEAFP